MKKIFLTSGIIACMACPAFAATATGPGFSTNDITTAAGRESPDTNIVDNACNIAVLGVDSGNTTLRAIWNPTYITVGLNKNASNPGYYSGDITSPTALYVADDVAYTSIAQNGQLTGAISASDTNGFLTQNLTGIRVNFTVHLNDSTESNGSTAATGGETEQNGTERTFKGITADQAGSGDILIGSDGKLTSAGTTAVADVSADTTWYAQYNAVHPSVTTPSRSGYTFGGWATSANGSAIENFANYNITETTAIYALWNKKQWNVTYNCGTSNVGTAAGWAEGYTSANTAKTAQFDTAFTHTSGSACTLTGYTFAGWNCVSGTTASATGGVADEGLTNGNWTFDANDNTVTCTATWATKTIGTITWNPNGANSFTQGSATTSCDYDTDVTLPANPTKTGYEFGGWQVVTE